MGNPTAVIAQGNGPGGQSSKSVKFEELKADVVGDEAKAEATYIVTLTDAPAALYAGGAGIYAPTAAFATGSNKFNPNTQAFAAYSKYLDGKQSEAAQSISKELGRNVKASHNYKVAANGFAMTMTGADAAKVRSLPGVLAVRKVTVYHLDTDAGPTWIGANTIWDGSSTGGLPATKGEGVIAGILDTGINLDHPSF
ncbi:MAG TPA: S8 family serine peptidase, partial [Thermoflexales bacterium]|nr:S8 family serine peptidase [Thermoflexales bacterium]